MERGTMGVLRWLAKISLAEWLIIGLALSWLVRRRPPSGSAPTGAGHAAPRPWAIDACVAVTVLGILAGAIWQQSSLSLIGFGAAALGLGLTVKSWARALGRALGRLLGKTGRKS
jgi:hypothetical protein